jgi:hypothetical protein
MEMNDTNQAVVARDGSFHLFHSSTRFCSPPPVLA